MGLGEKRYLASQLGAQLKEMMYAFLWEDVGYPEHMGHCEQEIRLSGKKLFLPCEEET